MVAHASISALRRQSQEKLCELSASLVYTDSARQPGGQRGTMSQQQQQQQTNLRTTKTNTNTKKHAMATHLPVTLGLVGSLEGF